MNYYMEVSRLFIVLLTFKIKIEIGTFCGELSTIENIK